jgi:hypothetical protein
LEIKRAEEFLRISAREFTAAQRDAKARLQSGKALTKKIAHNLTSAEGKLQRAAMAFVDSEAK